MSTLSQGQTLRTRAKSRVASNKVGYVTPDVPITYNSNGAVGVTTWMWTAPAKCVVVAIREVHSTVGAGASKIFIRKHVSGQTAAPSAATSGSNIVDLVTGGIAADAAVNVPQAPTVITTAASRQMNANDKLAIVCPGAWIGMVDVYVHWTA